MRFRRTVSDQKHITHPQMPQCPNAASSAKLQFGPQQRSATYLQAMTEQNAANKVRRDAAYLQQQQEVAQQQMQQQHLL